MKTFDQNGFRTNFPARFFSKLAISASMATTLLLVSTRVPILFQAVNEGHRNAQTATLTAGMIENGGLRLDPIAPWRGDLEARLVQELPIYNLTALAISALPGVTLDLAGRCASVLFWILSFIALQALWRRTLAPQSRFWANLLFVLSPMNWYLSISFMPESLLQLLAIGFMLGTLDYARRPGRSAYFLLLLTGLVGLLVKVPSFVHLGLFACLVIADRQGWKTLVNPSLLFAASLIVLTLLAWGEYVKEVNSAYFADWSGWANVVGFIRPEASRFSAAYYVPLIGYNLAFIVTLIGAPFVLLGLWHYVRIFKTSFVSRVWIYLFLSLVVSWLVWGKGAPSQNYYNLPNLVLFCAAFATGIGSVRRTLIRRDWSPTCIRWAASSVAASLMVFGVAGFTYLSRPDDVTIAAADWIRANAAPDEIILYQPRHSPAVIDYQHQPLLSYLSKRRTWIWTRGTPPEEKQRAMASAAYAIVTKPAQSGALETLRRKFKGTPSEPPQSITKETAQQLSKVYEDESFVVLAFGKAGS